MNGPARVRRRKGSLHRRSKRCLSAVAKLLRPDQPRAIAFGALFLALACAPVPPAHPTVGVSNAALAGSWELSHVGTRPVSRAISLTFNPDGTVTGAIRCNAWSGRYEARPSAIAFSEDIIITAAGCPGSWPADRGLAQRAERTLFGEHTAYLSADLQRLYLRGQDELRFNRTR